MEVRDYRKRRDAGQIEHRAIGNGEVITFAANYHPGTAEKLPDESTKFSRPGLINDRNNLVKRMEDDKELLLDLDALIEDVDAAAAAWDKKVDDLEKKAKKK